MNSSDIAHDYFRRARLRRATLDTLMAGEGFADVVRQSQELVELLLKGALRFVGFDPPRQHDVRHAVHANLGRFPPELRPELQSLAEAGSELASKRSRALYGDEEAKVPASALFKKQDAEAAIAVVDRMLAVYEQLLS